MVVSSRRLIVVVSKGGGGCQTQIKQWRQIAALPKLRQLDVLECYHTCVQNTLAD
jgi:hypothetical protein